MTAPGGRPQDGRPGASDLRPQAESAVPQLRPVVGRQRQGRSGPAGKSPQATRHPTAIPVTAQGYQGRRAGLVSRMVAATLDALVVLMLLLAGYLALLGARFMLSPQTFSFPSLSVVFAVAGFLGVLVVYLTASWATTGRTYGDHVMGLRVVNFRGRRMRWAGSFVRAVTCAFFPIGLLWVAVSRDNRSLQDLVLRTSVVYDWRDALPSGSEGT